MKKLLIIFLITAFTKTILPQAYIIETPITGLVQPVAFEFFPNGNVIITHKTSSARIYNLNNTLISTFWTFTDSLNSGFERGVLGVCLDPNYNSNNYVYIYYVHSIPPNSSTNQSLRVIRFTNVSNVGTNPFIVFSYYVGAINGNHVGGNLRFGPDDKLYITIGETAVSSNSQLLTNPKGKILRLNSNGTIPTDNPFYDDGNPETGNDDRIWAYGLRNSFDFCFSPLNDSLYASENGANTYDEVNFIRKGKNYGWPNCEGYCNPYNPLYKQPMAVWGSPLPSLTGIMIYTGSQMPWLTNKLLISDNDYGRIYMCNLGNGNLYDTVTSYTQILDLDGLTTLMQGTDGYIYALNGGYTNSGKLYRIKPDPSGMGNNNEPANFKLHQNFPNPFNPATNISFELANPSHAILKIYDILGNELVTLVNQKMSAGSHTINWNADSFPSGIYLYSLSVEGKNLDKKMVLYK